MSTLVCGKRDTFEEYYGSSPTPSKRSRFTARLSPPRALSAAEKSPLFQSCSGFEGASIARLREMFPGTDDILLQLALTTFNHDVDLAAPKVAEILNTASSGDTTPLVVAMLSMNMEEVSKLLVNEVTASTSAEAATNKTSRCLEAFEAAVKTKLFPEGYEKFQKDVEMVKAQLARLTSDNATLSRGIRIQFSRNQELEERAKEVDKLKSALSQCEEKIKSLEMTNYALAVHLRSSEPNSSFTHNFPPDVY